MKQQPTGTQNTDDLAALRAQVIEHAATRGLQLSPAATLSGMALALRLAATPPRPAQAATMLRAWLETTRQSPDPTNEPSPSPSPEPGTAQPCRDLREILRQVRAQSANQPASVAGFKRLGAAL